MQTQETDIKEKAGRSILGRLEKRLLISALGTSDFIRSFWVKCPKFQLLLCECAIKRRQDNPSRHFHSRTRSVRGARSLT